MHRSNAGNTRRTIPPATGTTGTRGGPRLTSSRRPVRRGTGDSNNTHGTSVSSSPSLHSGPHVAGLPRPDRERRMTSNSDKGESKDLHHQSSRRTDKGETKGLTKTGSGKDKHHKDRHHHHHHHHDPEDFPLEQKGRYERKRQLGRGSFGAVTLVKDTTDNRLYALKTIGWGNKERDKFTAMREVRLLKTLSHPCCVMLQDVFLHYPHGGTDHHGDGDDKDHHSSHHRGPSGLLCLVMTYCESGDLNKVLRAARKSKQQLKESQIISWFVQIILGIYYLHKRRIIHRDIKPQNIFLSDHRKHIKIGDFGLAKELRNSDVMLRAEVGTPLYTSPEIVSNQKYSFPSDVWSVGCILYECLALKPPFRGHTTMELVSAVCNNEPEAVEESFTPETRSLCRWLLMKNQKKRPTCGQILRIPALSKTCKHFATNFKPQGVAERLRRQQAKDMLTQLEQIEKTIEGFNLEDQCSVDMSTCDTPPEDKAGAQKDKAEGGAQAVDSSQGVPEKIGTEEDELENSADVPFKHATSEEKRRRPITRLNSDASCTSFAEMDGMSLSFANMSGYFGGWGDQHNGWGESPQPYGWGESPQPYGWGGGDFSAIEPQASGLEPHHGPPPPHWNRDEGEEETEQDVDAASMIAVDRRLNDLNGSQSSTGRSIGTAELDAPMLQPLIFRNISTDGLENTAFKVENDEKVRKSKNDQEHLGDLPTMLHQAAALVLDSTNTDSDASLTNVQRATEILDQKADPSAPEDLKLKRVESNDSLLLTAPSSDEDGIPIGETCGSLSYSVTQSLMHSTLTKKGDASPLHYEKSDTYPPASGKQTAYFNTPNDGRNVGLTMEGTSRSDGSSEHPFSGRHQTHDDLRLSTTSNIDRIRRPSSAKMRSRQTSHEDVLPPSPHTHLPKIVSSLLQDEDSDGTIKGASAVAVAEVRQEMEELLGSPMTSRTSQMICAPSQRGPAAIVVEHCNSLTGVTGAGHSLGQLKSYGLAREESQRQLRTAGSSPMPGSVAIKSTLPSLEDHNRSSPRMLTKTLEKSLERRSASKSDVGF